MLLTPASKSAVSVIVNVAADATINTKSKDKSRFTLNKSQWRYLRVPRQSIADTGFKRKIKKRADRAGWSPVIYLWLSRYLII